MVTIKQIAEEDFKVFGNNGNSTSFNMAYIEEVKTALTENKGSIIGLNIEEGLLNFIGKSENPTKALNVKIRTLYKGITKNNPNQKVSIDNQKGEIQVDLR